MKLNLENLDKHKIFIVLHCIIFNSPLLGECRNAFCSADELKYQQSMKTIPCFSDPNL